MATLLVTNDDGAKSLLWSGLCDALEAAGHEVYGVAPAENQSWIGCAQTTGRELAATPLGNRRWSVDGTPADCVGIAPYLAAKPFDAVISGINLGVNTRLPMVISSGTVGAATVSSMMGYKAIAFSWACPRELAISARKADGILPETHMTAQIMFNRCVERTRSLLKENYLYGRVYNINFPAKVSVETLWKKLPMSITTLLQTFERLPNGRFKHSPNFERPLSSGETEFGAIGSGNITESIIDWPKAGIMGEQPVP
jgi:5'-nucleotidase